jgi:exodeoxyribonuclease VII large subunit
VDKLESKTLETQSISVTQLNKLAKTLLENNMPIFWIKGEISGLKIYNHAYFDLKDENSKISCILFANILKEQNFTLENGQEIEVRGRVTIYMTNGNYQINVERIRKIGIGELWERYQQLVTKLKQEELFAASHKKQLPVFPSTIGIVTSKEGSVLRDVIATLKRRGVAVKIIIYHTAVQGIDATTQITNAIRTANLRNEVDVIIVCRGGGSIQDLWAFNEEMVVREVFASHIPIISAIGHETDTTIIDFVADLRAPTPTAAAEMVAKSQDEWLTLIKQLTYKISQQIFNIINDKKQQVDINHSKLKLLNPVNQVYEHIKLINTNTLRLNNAIKQQVRRSSVKLNNLIKQLQLVSPTNVLERGYAIIKNKNNKIITANSDVSNNEEIQIIVKQDTITAIIKK